MNSQILIWIFQIDPLHWNTAINKSDPVSWIRALQENFTMSNALGFDFIDWVKKEEKKVEHALDPTNQEVVEYCKSLIGVGFQGETSNKVDLTLWFRDIVLDNFQ